MKHVSKDDLKLLKIKADESPRRRAHHLLHASAEDPVQRICLYMHQGSYVQPHRHVAPDRWELFTLVRGSAVALVFADDGRVMDRTELRAGGELPVIEFAPGVWHTLTAMEDDTILMETKPGPYIPVADKDFAAWAPREGEPETALFANWFMRCAEGDMPDSFS